MAISVPARCWRQPEESQAVDASGGNTFVYILKGDYSALKTLAGTIHQGTEIVAGWVANTMQLVRGRGNSATLTINCVPADTATDPQTQQSVTTPLKDTWSIKSVRNDVSVMAYCSATPGSPQREQIEAWQREPDGALAKLNQYRKPNGKIEEIEPGSPTAALLTKIRHGVESVMRFYPVVTRTRIYSSCPPACLENLGYIDTPDASGTQQYVRKPNGLTTAIAAHQWVKCQDDAQENSDGTWSRIEAWMGIRKTDHNNNQPWDADLYGAARWPMPYILGTTEDA